MKKSISVILIIMMLFSFTACKNEPAVSKEASELGGSSVEEVTSENVSSVDVSSVEATSSAATSSDVQSKDNEKYIAFTFDDGPSLDITPEILSLFEQYNGAVTFFAVGRNVTEDKREIMARAVKMGCEYGNHSYNHKSFTEITPAEMLSEIEETQKVIRTIAGVTPTLFRAPNIAVNQTVFDTVKMPFISGYNPSDWDKNVTAQQRIERVLSNAKDGQIVLMHEFKGNTQTVEALKTILPSLANQGYKFVTVSELFKIKGIELTAGGKNIKGAYTGGY